MNDNMAEVPPTSSGRKGSEENTPEEPSRANEPPPRLQPKPHRCNYLLDPFISAIVTDKSPSKAIEAFKPFLKCLRESPPKEDEERTE